MSKNVKGGFYTLNLSESGNGVWVFPETIDQEELLRKELAKMCTSNESYYGLAINKPVMVTNFSDDDYGGEVYYGYINISLGAIYNKLHEIEVQYYIIETPLYIYKYNNGVLKKLNKLLDNYQWQIVFDNM